MKTNPQQKRQHGVSLMELMITVAIISIVAAVAYPSYTQFVVRSKRVIGTGALMAIADRQQQFFMDNKRYANSLTNLGYDTATIMIDEEGSVVAAGDEDRVYNVQITAATAITYELTATPQLQQAAKDKCGSLTLTHTGEKGKSGEGDNCW
jgi:type IV pilus assembly protein PilE